MYTSTMITRMLPSSSAAVVALAISIGLVLLANQEDAAVSAFSPSLPSALTTPATAACTPSASRGTTTATCTTTTTTWLGAAAGKKKRRRRKTIMEDPVKQPEIDKKQVDGGGDRKIDASLDDEDDDDEDAEDLTMDDGIDSDTAPAFEFQPPKADPAIDPKAISPPPPSSSSASDGQIPLPDIRDQLKRKELQQKIAQMEAEEEANKVKIKRSDKEAFRKLLEQQPFADADDSFFEEEAYNTVSALLGERAKPFLGIPTGPLQVGHLIGALGIILMAFVEYPGFPLTNLPTPIRDALAGGLGTVYAINTVLAIVSIFKAQERGQPVPLWVTKTFLVGGLAYDQLTQLPTTAEIERVQAVKGARALKNQKR